MVHVDPKKVSFIRPRMRHDYVVEGMEAAGYTNTIPYRDYNIFFRLAREIWFRIGLPERFWYNPKIRDIKTPNIVIYDSLTTPGLVSFVVENHPDKKIYLSYENRANCVVSPNPDSIKEKSVIKVTYEKSDAKKYGMVYLVGDYSESNIVKNDNEKIYDIVYVARDKGRGDKALEFEKKLNEMGLRTYFHICGDRRVINKHKRYYKPLLQYKEYLEIIAKTKAILNIMPEGQEAVTVRDFEVVFNGIKGITNNKWIKNFKLYDPSRFFILGERPIEELPAFIEEEFKPIPEEELEPYTGGHWLQELLKH
ncbi:MAG: hypothetical protein IJJ48_03425 [Firmicutes bacterium]|nr:hypothetical protein [Bacillota bacterium]